MSSLEELGSLSYQKAVWSDFKGALVILDKAIAKYPHDPRLYNNRCYCYSRLKDFKRALAEAEYMIKEFPNYIRSFYRKAEVLIDLKKFNDAEIILQELLKLDSSCQEATFLLTEVQLILLRRHNIHSVRDSVTALQLTNYNLKQAIAFLEVGGMKDVNKFVNADLYKSDIDDEPSAPPTTIKITSNGEYDPCIDPNNPYNSYSIWVGNVTKKVTEEMIKPIFSKYGKIKNIIVQHQNFCAFVNYYDANMAANAMKKFPQNYAVADTALVIRFPDNAKSTTISNSGGKKNTIKVK